MKSDVLKRNRGLVLCVCVCVLRWCWGDSLILCVSSLSSGARVISLQLECAASFHPDVIFDKLRTHKTNDIYFRANRLIKSATADWLKSCFEFDFDFLFFFCFEGASKNTSRLHIYMYIYMFILHVLVQTLHWSHTVLTEIFTRMMFHGCAVTSHTLGFSYACPCDSAWRMASSETSSHAGSVDINFGVCFWGFTVVVRHGMRKWKGRSDAEICCVELVRKRGNDPLIWRTNVELEYHADKGKDAFT